MRPVFSNSAWVKAPARLILRNGSWRMRRLRVRYGLFVHPTQGPILIDTGYTAHSLSGADRSFWLRAYGRMLAPTLNNDAQPAPFLQRFGLRPSDIAAVIVTHFHADHVSGLNAFPNARFIASRLGYEALIASRGFANIRHGMFPELLPAEFETQLSPIEACVTRPVQHLQDGYDLFGDGSVLAIPLPGHAAGHFGLLFPQLPSPLLYATDTQWLLEALPASRRPRFAPRLISEDYQASCTSADQVDAFRRAGGTVMLCHDDVPARYDVEEGATL